MLMKRNKLLIILLFSLVVVSLTFLVGAKESSKNAMNDMEILADEMILEKNNMVAIGNVEVNSNQGIMTGDRFEVDNNSQTGLMTGDSPVLKSQGWRVTGKRFEIDFNTEEVFVPQNAHLQSDTIVADANQLRLLQQKNLAILTEDVVVINKERRLTGKKVTINLKTEKMTSEGKTKLTFPPSELESEGKDNDN
ncbi:LptA/OstA family protein [Sporohalobacter salinus]|uniref:LptA/OstA family protein n=1 Tax=Sporohalobacter salinus TaxID=1494606 RepID=UPI00195FA33F|nr:LptA/OstA family protein [Sporohalobacter salinus]MBM7622937.1 lipopolysaccharide export system protein LptA [Sporohalobacter salinus]